MADTNCEAEATLVPLNVVSLKRPVLTSIFEMYTSFVNAVSLLNVGVGCEIIIWAFFTN